MLVLFLCLVAAGVAAFVFVFMQEFTRKEGVRPVVIEPVLLQGGAGDGAMAAAAEKIRRLEKLLEEKNADIARLQKNVPAGQDYTEQTEKLKNILQEEIEALKQQNKSVREELSKVLEENMSLQAKVFSSDVRKSSGGALGDHEPAPVLSLQDVFSSGGKNTNYQ